MDSESSIYGCYNRADFKDRLSVQDGWEHSMAQTRRGYTSIRTAAMKSVKDTSTKHCVYTLTHQSDKYCQGCSRYASQQVKP